MAKIRKKPKKSINKNINKKSFTQSTPNIAEKLDNEMVAFLDTESIKVINSKTKDLVTDYTASLSANATSLL